MFCNKILGKLRKNVKAFTLVEVLVALTVIGIVAAMTYPTLQPKVQELMFRVHKKVLHTRVAQAMSLINSLKDYSSGVEFLDKYRDHVKLHMVCEGDKFHACDLPRVFTALDGNIYRMPRKWSELAPELVETYYEDSETGSVYENYQDDFDSIAFITDNQESVNLFYNTSCSTMELKDNPEYFLANSVCINMIFDLNGSKPPNIVGQDIGFITVFKPVESMVVAPVPYLEDVIGQASSVTSAKACHVQKNTLRVPTDYELASMYVNKKFLGFSGGNYWSSTLHSTDNAWYLWSDTGMMMREPFDRSVEMALRCVAR